MEKKLVRLDVNGQVHELYLNPKTLLVEAIRIILGLQAPKGAAKQYPAVAAR
jgi:aerobic-type carbon monoxide dehydrogenase small subunit (CoxS/CutS family)